MRGRRPRPAADERRLAARRARLARRPAGDVRGPDRRRATRCCRPLADRLTFVEGSLDGHGRKAVYRGDYKLLASRGHGVEVGYGLPDETVTDIPEAEYKHLSGDLPPWPSTTGDRSVAGNEMEVDGVVEDRFERPGYK